MSCKDCKFWGEYKDNEYYIRPHNPKKAYEGYDSEEDEVENGFNKVRRCKSSNILFYKRPLANQAAIFDGSDYKGEFYTGENFSCSLFEQK